METTVIAFNITSSFEDWINAYDESLPTQKGFGLDSLYRGHEKDDPIKCVVIASDHDRMVKLEVSKSMSAEMPNSIFLPIENCGHFQHIEQTELVANEIANFLENHSKKTGSRRV